MGKAIGCGVIALVVAAIMFVFGSFMVKQGGDNAREAKIVAGLTPQLAVAIERASPGERVLVLGQIDPDAALAEPNKGLAMYTSERYEVRRRSKGRNSHSWENAAGSSPPFRLLTGDGEVQVDGGYAQELPSYSEQGRSVVGELRYHGFRPGDSVLVDGVVQRGGLDGRTVVGGDHDQYVALLQSRASSSKTIGIVLMVVSALTILGGIAFAVKTLRSRPRQTVAVGGDYGNLQGGYSPPPAQAPFAGAAPGRQCPNCYSPVGFGEQFCGRCGARVG